MTTETERNMTKEEKSCFTCEFFDELSGLCYAHDCLVTEKGDYCDKWQSHKESLELEK